MSFLQKVITATVFIIFIFSIGLIDYFIANIKISESFPSDGVSTNSPSFEESLSDTLASKLNLIEGEESVSQVFLSFNLQEPVQKTVYQNKDKEDVITVYSLPFSGHDIAITKLQDTIRKQFTHQDADIFPYPTYGDQSWIIRLAKDQKNMYLVLSTNGRLLGIEYILGENLSRHKAIESVLIPILTQ